MVGTNDLAEDCICGQKLLSSNEGEWCGKLNPYARAQIQAIPSHQEGAGAGAKARSRQNYDASTILGNTSSDQVPKRLFVSWKLEFAALIEEKRQKVS